MAKSDDGVAVSHEILGDKLTAGLAGGAAAGGMLGLNVLPGVRPLLGSLIGSVLGVGAAFATRLRD